MAITELEAKVPVVARGEVPVEQMTAAQLLSDVALQGLRQLRAIVYTPLDMTNLDPPNLKLIRLVGDMAIGSNKLLMHAAEGEFRMRRDDAVTQLLEMLAEEERLDKTRRRLVAQTAVVEEPRGPQETR